MHPISGKHLDSVQSSYLFEDPPISLLSPIDSKLLEGPTEHH